FYTATSLDGFIAGPGQSLDWLFTRKQDDDGPLNYDAFIADIGSIAMGRTTYEWVLNHEKGKWPYDIPAWVFTHQELATVEGDVRFTQDDVATVHADMVEAAGDKDVWMVGGGDLAGQFADAGLLDEIIVYIAPVFLGAGAPLFPPHQELELVELAQNGDFACARYAVVRPSGTG
ncbi:MAG: dihydrofolate reductase family protein, partial [Aeromicrobium sp.]